VDHAGTLAVRYLLASTSLTLRLAGWTTITEVAGSDIDHAERYGLLQSARW
jgi:hypothetical protein